MTPRMQKALELNKEKFNTISFNLCRTIELTEEEIQFCIDFGIQKEAYAHEHGRDRKKVAHRFATGLSGELAIEHYIKRKFANTNVGSRKLREFAGADLKSIKLPAGVKTFTEPWMPPMYHRDTLYPQIIVFASQKLYKFSLQNKPINDTFIVLGLATPHIMRVGCNSDYIGTEEMRDEDKTAFIDIDKVIYFDSYEELEKLCKLN